MSLEHEYALLGGYNRSHVGRWLAQIAGVVSAIIVFLLLLAVDIANTLGINANLPPVILSLVGAGTVYLALYALLDHYAWKIGPLGRFLKVPDLSGTWHCDGLGLDKQPPVPWEGVVTIVQSWDKLRVHLKTSQSSSNSIAAALQHDEACGFRLMYHYRNEPKLGEVDLAPHHGFAELTFGKNGLTAEGSYFNGRGRNTFGTMKLTREAG